MEAGPDVAESGPASFNVGYEEKEYKLAFTCKVIVYMRL